MISRNNYTNLDAPVGPYVHAVTYKGTFHSSGITAYGTNADGSSIINQTKEIFKQLVTMLHAENSGLEKLIKVTIYVTDLSKIGDLRKTLFEIYGNHIPASTVIEVSRFFTSSVDIEIEAIAAVD